MVCVSNFTVHQFQKTFDKKQAQARTGLSAGMRVSVVFFKNLGGIRQACLSGLVGYPPLPSSIAMLFLSRQRNLYGGIVQAVLASVIQQITQNDGQHLGVSSQWCSVM